VTKDNRTPVHFDRELNGFVGLSEDAVQELRKAYPQVDITRELVKMSFWLNSSKGKNHVGTMQFILNWLDRAPSTQISQSNETANVDYSLRLLLDEYLKDLWKGREHILNLNTIRKKS
jgi:hypothetical protein